MHHTINLTTAVAKNSPINPSTPMLKYHTPILIFNGHSGNMTPARTTPTIAPAMRSPLTGFGSRNQA